MSIRTLIEINHDYLSDIEQDPEAFTAAVVNAVTNQRDTRHFGIAKKWSRHHSDPCPLDRDEDRE